jgi:acetylornithine deacetylase/succinyl-diaminopimelate desuccinylase-like protein
MTNQIGSSFGKTLPSSYSLDVKNGFEDSKQQAIHPAASKINSQSVKAPDDNDGKPTTPEQQLFYDILKELVEIDTSESANSAKDTTLPGGTLKVAQAMAKRLTDAGFDPKDVQIFQTGEQKGNLVARLRGTGKKDPILLLAHTDVIPVKREEWETDPFKLTVVKGKNGPEFRGRGVIDDKAMAASYIANLIGYKHEGFKPDRDIIVALTTDEELSDENKKGIRWLIENHPELIKAGFAINENGGDEIKDGKPVRQNMQVAEKIYQSFNLKAEGAGSHSALPKPADTSAINHLSRGIANISKLQFPIQPIPAVLAYFEKIAPTETPEIQKAIRALLAGSKDSKELAPLLERPEYNAQLRDTCVTTILNAGQAENSVPRSASATVQCRLLPGNKISNVQQKLTESIDDSKVTVTLGKGWGESPASPLNPEITQTVERIASDMFPGTSIIPVMSAGASDGRYLRGAGIPVYGLMGLFLENEGNAHDRNENGGVKQVYDSNKFVYRLIKDLAGSVPQK